MNDFENKETEIQNDINYDRDKYFSSLQNAELGQEGKLAPGIALGLLMSIGGYIIWFILDFIGFYAAIASYFIGYLFYKGLVMNKVRITKNIIIIITAYTFLSALIACYFSLAFSVFFYAEGITFMTAITKALSLAKSLDPALVTYFYINVAIASIMSAFAAYRIYKNLIGSN